jgi:hypothetical protein
MQLIIQFFKFKLHKHTCCKRVLEKRVFYFSRTFTRPCDSNSTGSTIKRSDRTEIQPRTENFGVERAEARGKAEHLNSYEVERIRVDFHITLSISVFSP